MNTQIRQFVCIAVMMISILTIIGCANNTAVRVTTNPSRTTVKVYDEQDKQIDKGVTPTTIRLPQKGSYRFDFEKEGYYAKSENYVEDGVFIPTEWAKKSDGYGAAGIGTIFTLMGSPLAGAPLFLTGGYILMRYYQGDPDKLTVSLSRIPPAPKDESVQEEEEVTPKIRTWKDKAYIRVTGGYQIGMNVPSEYTCLSPFFTEPALSEDVKKQIVIGVDTAYEINSSQLFGEFQLSFGLPMAEYYENADSPLVWTASGYIGATKWFWFGRNAITANASFGADFFAMTMVLYGEPLTYWVYGPGIKSGLGYNFKIASQWLLTLGAEYKLAMPPFKGNIIYGGETIDFDTSEYGDMRLGGLKVGLGVTYSFGGFN